MKSLHPILLGLSVCCMSVLLSCDMSSENTDYLNQSVKKLKGIDPPMDGVQKPFGSYSVDTELENAIQLPNGSRINIPQHAFVDAQGVRVDGEVEIKYREFHNAAEVILSGIPMYMNQGDDFGHLQTAGMFEIKGFQDDQEVFIAPGLTINVEMASLVEGNDYQFLQLEESEDNWKSLGTGDAVVNEEKKQRVENWRKNMPIKPNMPAKGDKDKFVFDLDVDYDQAPELKAFNDVVWQYAGDGGADDPESNSEVFNRNWEDAQISRVDEGTYELVLTDKDFTFATRVRPVLSEAEFKDQLSVFEEKLAEYETKMVASKAEETQLNAEADVMRAFEISSFGIYNWDRIYKMDKPVALNANFKMPDGTDLGAEDVSIYHVTGDERAVIRYEKEEFDNFNYTRAADNKLLAITSNREVAFFGDEDFENLQLDEDQEEYPPRYTFEMKSTQKTINSPEELQALINAM